VNRTPKWLPAAIAALAAATLLAAAAPLLAPFELKTLDARMRWLREKQGFRDDVVFISISQASLNYGKKEQGWGWPWPRDVYALLIDTAAEGGAKQFVSDLGFTENQAASNDQALGASAAKYGRFLLATPFTDDPADDSVLPDEFVRRFSVTVRGEPPAMATFLCPPIEPAWKGSKRVVSPRLVTDEDGVHRRYPLLFKARGAWYPSMGLAAYLELTGATEIVAEPGALVVAGRRIPIDADGCLRLNFHARDVDVVRHDAGVVISSALRRADGLPAQLGPEVFKDKTVILAAWAQGLLDFKASPLSGADASAVVHGTALSNLVNGDFLRPLPRPGGFFVLLAVCLAVALPARLLRLSWAVPIALLVPVLFVAASLAAFKARLWIELVPPLTGAVLVFAAVQVLNYLLEGRQRAITKRAFQQYLAPNVVDKILDSAGGPPLEGARKPLSVMFLDFAGFTTLSETLDPVALVSLLKEYNNETVGAIHATEGTLDKFIGDAVMAFWNDPVAQPDHEARACLAAVDIQRRLKALGVKIAERGLTQMYARIGINSGIVTVGNMGSDRQFNYTAMGDQVNLASRLEGVNKEFGTQIIASESTVEKARGQVEVRELAIIRVKGKKKGVRIFEIVGAKGAVPAAMLAALRTFEEALAAFRRRDWSKAAEGFGRVGDNPSKVYLHLCEEYAQHPPPEDWDGTYIMEHK
jgi:adenylate cyclase